MTGLPPTYGRASGAGTRAGSCSQPTACSAAGSRGSRVQAFGRGEDVPAPRGPDTGRAGRAGALVVLLEGVLVLYVERGGRALTAAGFRQTPRGLRLRG